MLHTAIEGASFFSAAQIGAFFLKRGLDLTLIRNPYPNPKLSHRLNTHLTPICAAEKNNALRDKSMLYNVIFFSPPIENSRSSFV